MKKDKGITLIAVIITIIVLIILAGISIIIVVRDNGLIDKTLSTKEQSNKAYAYERVYSEVTVSRDSVGRINLDKLNRNLRENLEKIDLKAEDGSYSQLTEENRIEQLPITVKYRGYDFYINEENNVDGDGNGNPIVGVLIPGDIATSTEKNNYKDPNGDTATIPSGFKVSDEKYTIDDGLVVIGPDGSEFVWIPVDENLKVVGTEKAMAKISTKEGFKDTDEKPNYEGVLYDFLGSGEETRSVEMKNYEDMNGCREPDVLRDNYDNRSDYLDIIRKILPTQTEKYKDRDTFKTTMQEDYNEMIESVKKYGGFFVGRYEIGIEGSRAISKKGPAADATKYKGNTWYGLYAYGKTYTIEQDSVRSSMIWGSQYDAMLNYALTNPTQKDRVNAETHGNHSGRILDTGATSDDIILNIYDLEGNHFEWTLEVKYEDYRIRRGGYYERVIETSHRNYPWPHYTTSDTSSRLTLYIK